MIELSDMPGGAGRALFAADSRPAIAESLAMLAEECADLFAQACARFTAFGKKSGRGHAAGARRGVAIVERLGRLQGWIDLHRRALDAGVDPAQFDADRSALTIECPDDVAPLGRAFTLFDEIDVALRRLEGRIRRLDDLLHRPQTS